MATPWVKTPQSRERARSVNMLTSMETILVSCLWDILTTLGHNKTKWGNSLDKNCVYSLKKLNFEKQLEDALKVSWPQRIKCNLCFYAHTQMNARRVQYVHITARIFPFSLSLSLPQFNSNGVLLAGPFIWVQQLCSITERSPSGIRHTISAFSNRWPAHPHAALHWAHEHKESNFALHKSCTEKKQQLEAWSRWLA